MLRLEARLMLALFRPTCEAIREHIAAVLDHRGLKNVRYLFLVGGFAESQVLQKAIRDEFHSKVSKQELFKLTVHIISNYCQ